MTKPKVPTHQLVLRINAAQREFLDSLPVSAAAVIRTMVNVAMADRQVFAQALVGYPVRLASATNLAPNPNVAPSEMLMDPIEYAPPTPAVRAVPVRDPAPTGFLQPSQDPQPSFTPKVATTPMNFRWPDPPIKPALPTFIKGRDDMAGPLADDDWEWIYFRCPREGEVWTQHSIWPHLGVIKHRDDGGIMFWDQGLFAHLGISDDDARMECLEPDPYTITIDGMRFLGDHYVWAAIKAYRSRSIPPQACDIERLARWIKQPGV